MIQTRSRALNRRDRRMTVATSTTLLTQLGVRKALTIVRLRLMHIRMLLLLLLELLRERARRSWLLLCRGRKRRHGHIVTGRGTRRTRSDAGQESLEVTRGRHFCLFWFLSFWPCAR